MSLRATLRDVATDDVVLMRRQLEEVIDECVVVEKQLATERGRSHHCELALEQLLSYVALIESRVLIPAFGQLTVALARHLDASDRRTQGLSQAAIGLHGAAQDTNQRFSRLLSAMRAPLPETQIEAERGRALNPAVPPALSVEDGYVALANLLREAEGLGESIRASATAFRAAAQFNTSNNGSSSSPPVGNLRMAVVGSGHVHDTLAAPASSLPYDQRVAFERIVAENRAAQAEMTHMQQSCEARLVADQKDRALVEVKLDDALRRLDEAERDRDAWKIKAGTAEGAEQLYQQAGIERRLLQERLLQLESQLSSHDAERVVVAQKFGVLQRALDAATSGMNVSGGHVSAHHHASAQNRHSPQRMAGPPALPTQELDVEPFALPTNLRAAQAEVAQYRRELENTRREARDREAHLEKELMSLQRRMTDGGSPGRGSPYRGGGWEPSPLNGGGSPQQQNHLQPSQSKLRALELTVQALNSELAALEDKVVSMERDHEQEKLRLQQSLMSEVSRFEKDQRESDVVFADLTKELQASMADNTQLRHRLKHFSSARGASQT